MYSSKIVLHPQNYTFFQVYFAIILELNSNNRLEILLDTLWKGLCF